MFGFVVRSVIGKATPRLTDLFVGEWDLVDRKSLKADYSVEFHYIGDSLYGSIWQNTESKDTKILPITDGELAQVYLGIEGNSKGTVHNITNDEVISTFSIAASEKAPFSIKGRFNEINSYSVTLHNSSFITVVLSQKGVSKVHEYVIQKPVASGKEPFFGQYQTIAIILIIAFIVQGILVICFCKCKDSAKQMEEQIEILKGQRLKKME